MQIVGLMMVRNEVDIVRVNILHHLTLGIDRFLVLDNGSSDGTDRVLDELSRDGRVHWTRDPGLYRRAEITTRLAREAARDGADWLVPIDADEFWYAQRGDFRQVLERSSGGVVQARAVNFIQHREQVEASPRALLHMTRRPSRPVEPIERAEEFVEARQIGFVEIRYPPKCISRASLAVEMAQENCSLTGVPVPQEETDQIVCLHAPLRARSVLEAKADQGRPEAELLKDPAPAWHKRRWRRLAEEGSLELEWRANSYADDHLDVYGVRRHVIFDPTLRDLVVPWVDRSSAEPERPRGAVHALRPKLDLQVESTPGLFAEAVLARMRGIEGWLSEPEASALMATTALALMTPQPRAVVEIGSYCGRSTVVLGSVVQAVCPAVRVYAIDPHQGQLSRPDAGNRYEAPSLDRFRRNIAEAGLTDIVEVIQKHSYDVVWRKPISLLFIDGLHDYLNVSRDFAGFARWVVPGGYVVFDDCDSTYPDVMAFVEEVLGSGQYREVLRAGKVIVTQKLLGAASSVDGWQDEPGGPRTRVTAAGGVGPDEAARHDDARRGLAELESLRDRLARQERGIAVLRDVLREDVARWETPVRERDWRIQELDEKVGEANEVIRGLQAELDEKVGEANEVIRSLQAELHEKVGEANEVIRGLQGELHAKVGAAKETSRGPQAQLDAKVGAAKETSRGPQAQLDAKEGEANEVIRGLQAELDAIHRSRAWRIVSRYWALRERLRLHRSVKHAGS